MGGLRKGKREILLFRTLKRVCCSSFYMAITMATKRKSVGMAHGPTLKYQTRCQFINLFCTSPQINNLPFPSYAITSFKSVKIYKYAWSIGFVYWKGLIVGWNIHLIYLKSTTPMQMPKCLVAIGNVWHTSMEIRVQLLM